MTRSLLTCIYGQKSFYKTSTKRRHSMAGQVVRVFNILETFWPPSWGGRPFSDFHKSLIGLPWTKIPLLLKYFNRSSMTMSTISRRTLSRSEVFNNFSMAKNPSYGEKIFKMLSMTKIHFTELKLLEVLQQYSMAGTNLPWPEVL